MKYIYPIQQATYLDRPNRFIGTVEIEGRNESVHIKNTGRCKELFIPGATVYLEYSESPSRKTKYDLIAVEKNGRIINVDSQAANKIAAEYLRKTFPDHTLLKPEVKYGKSRFDFYLETPVEKWFIEVKGVTLEENGIARFPDAPTERGVKHVEELISCISEGYRAMILFVIKMKGVICLEPNMKTHPAFGNALRKAHQAGVVIRAVDCIVTADSVIADKEIPIIL